MRETLTIGPTPADEDCAQVGQPGYEERARAECAQFIKAIKRTLGEPPEGASLRIKANSHDFGTYHEVAVVFDANNRKAMAYALKVDNEAPGEWAPEDRKALGLHYAIELRNGCYLSKSSPDHGVGLDNADLFETEEEAEEGCEGYWAAGAMVVTVRR